MVSGITCLFYRRKGIGKQEQPTMFYIYANVRKLCTRWSSRPKNCHYYYSIRPIIVLSRCFGLNPFSFKTNVFGEVYRTQITFFDALWFVAAITMYVTLTVLVSMHISLAPELESVYLLVLGDQLLLAFALVMCVVGVVMDMVNRNRILRNIQRFEAFDKEVNTKFNTRMKTLSATNNRSLNH